MIKNKKEISLISHEVRQMFSGALNYPELIRQAICCILKAPWQSLSLTSQWQAASNSGIDSCSLVGRVGTTNPQPSLSGLVGMVITLNTEDQPIANNPSAKCGSPKLPGEVPEEIAELIRSFIRQGFRVTQCFGSGNKGSKLPNLIDGHITLTLGQPAHHGSDARGLIVKFGWGLWLNGHKIPEWAR